MTFWLIAGLLLVAAAATGGRTWEQARTRRLVRALHDAGSGHKRERVRFDSLPALPPAVARYLELALCGQGRIRTARLNQRGVLRVSPQANRWLRFEARQLVVPASTGFVWDARVEVPLGLHLRVVDSYVGGTGSGRISLMSMIRLAKESGRPELDSGALHRYLAEAVWFPSALLPESGVRWTRIDSRAALATLTHGATTVSLQFRFNGAGEVVGIYAPARWASSGGGYHQLPWEGRFADYRDHSGLRIPFRGEVGWHVDGKLELVWKGELRDARYAFDAGD